MPQAKRESPAHLTIPSHLHRPSVFLFICTGCRLPTRRTSFLSQHRMPASLSLSLLLALSLSLVSDNALLHGSSDLAGAASWGWHAAQGKGARPSRLPDPQAVCRGAWSTCRPPRSLDPPAVRRGAGSTCHPPRPPDPPAVHRPARSTPPPLLSFFPDSRSRLCPASAGPKRIR
jgi:hypothetical protein